MAAELPHPRISPQDLNDLPLVPGAPRLIADNALRGPGRRLDAAGSVGERLVAFAITDPDRPAVVEATGTTTYRQLYQRVGLIRSFLLAQGCMAGDRVALLAARDSVTIAAFLALESIGAVYLPLDPAWPVARLITILRHSRPRLLVVPAALLPADPPEWTDVLAAAGEAGVIVRSLRGIGATDLPAAAPWTPRTCGLREPRYVIHTSGSTGQPKGAVVEHQGMMNHLLSMVTTLRLDTHDVVGFTAAPGYVISIWQMLAAFLAGATVATFDAADLLFGRRLISHAERTGVTILELVPTAIDGLVEDARRRASPALPRLRYLLSTGEQLRVSLAARVLDTFPHALLVNAYGSSECSDDVSHHVVSAADFTKPSLPIGAPIPNTSLYVLVDEGGMWRAAGPAEIGELWIGGAGVGLGYVHDPQATQAAFFVDCLDGDSPTGRLYRTGDVACCDDGRIYCRGRADRQVAVGGVRIELGEIEAAVMGHPLVKHCAATVEDEHWRNQIAVYYVASDAVHHADLQAFLRSRLPEGMLPRRLIQMDAIPVNGNGKIDYSALGNPSPHRRSRSS